MMYRGERFLRNVGWRGRERESERERQREEGKRGRKWKRRMRINVEEGQRNSESAVFLHNCM